MPSAQNTLHSEVAELYTHHHGWLQAWLRKKLGNAHQAADLAQDTFVRLLSRDAPMQAREPRAFLTTVAQRVLANHYRRLQLERAYLEALAQLPPVRAPSPEERALLLEALDAIDRMLDGLPPAVRRAFLMAQLEGMKQAEIAQALGLSVNTIQRYLAQAGMHCYFAVAA